MLLFLASYLGPNSPVDIYFITIGILVIIIGFYTEGKRVNFSVGYFFCNNRTNNDLNGLLFFLRFLVILVLNCYHNKLYGFKCNSSMVIS